MRLARYLSLSYAILIVLLIYLAGVGQFVDASVPTKSLIMLSPLTAAAGVFIGIYPSAIRVPLERRTSFWAYRASNARLYIGGAIALAFSLLAAAIALRS